MKIKASSRKMCLVAGVVFWCCFIFASGIAFSVKGLARFSLGEIELLAFPYDSLVSYLLFGVIDIAAGIACWIIVRPVVAVIWRANGHVAIIPYDGKNVTLFEKEK